MDQLPQLMDEKPPMIVRAAAYLLVPLAVVLALPVLLLIILALYVFALFHGGRVFFMFVTGKAPPPQALELQKPHFLEMQTPAQSLPDENTPTS